MFKDHDRFDIFITMIWNTYFQRSFYVLTNQPMGKLTCLVTPVLTIGVIVWSKVTRLIQWDGLSNRLFFKPLRSCRLSINSTEEVKWHGCPTCMTYMLETRCIYLLHDDVIKWKHFPRYWLFVRVNHRSLVNFPHKGQWRGALMFSLRCAWTNGWVNNRDAGDLSRHRGHYDATVMIWFVYSFSILFWICLQRVDHSATLFICYKVKYNAM